MWRKGKEEEGLAWYVSRFRSLFPVTFFVIACLSLLWEMGGKEEGNSRLLRSFFNCRFLDVLIAWFNKGEREAVVAWRRGERRSVIRSPPPLLFISIHCCRVGKKKLGKELKSGPFLCRSANGIGCGVGRFYQKGGKIPTHDRENGTTKTVLLFGAPFLLCC